MFLAATVGEVKMRGVQLVAICNVTARYHCILHTGPFNILTSKK